MYPYLILPTHTTLHTHPAPSTYTLTLSCFLSPLLGVHMGNLFGKKEDESADLDGSTPSDPPQPSIASFDMMGSGCNCNVSK